MANTLFEYAVKFIADDKDVNDKTEDVKGKLSGLSSFLGGIGAAGVAAFAAVGTATVAIGKQAVDAYANYEQLAGGIEKLFGEEGAGIVAQYAEQAFLTSGKSINEYYNSVSQITASLKRSIGDDMGEVARVADVAMQVISDNVNTFGSETESVENAIMGLSRQNYTMIDNLKLGYAGTAQGMLELINDSGVLGKKLTDTSQLATVGFDQMILAIQAVQEQQGIAGTTAKEAMKTIEGSAKATKSAWQNVITAIGRGEGISDALSGLSTALFGEEEGEGFVSQMANAVKRAMEGIGDFVVEAVPLIIEKLPEVVSAIIPPIFRTTTSLFAQLGQFIIQQLPVLFDSGIQALNGFVDGMRSKMPDIISFAVDMIGNVAGWIIQNLPTIINTGMKLIGALVQGLVAELPHIVATVWDLAKQAFDAFFKVDWFSLGRDIIGGIVKGLERYGSQIKDTLKNFAKSAFNGIKDFFGIESPSKLMRDEIGRYIPEGIAEGIRKNEDSVFDAMSDIPDIATSGFESNGMSFGNSFGSESGDMGVIVSLLQQIASDGLNVTLEGDANQIFKVVRKQSANFEKAKGYSAI